MMKPFTFLSVTLAILVALLTISVQLLRVEAQATATPAIWTGLFFSTNSFTGSTQTATYNDLNLNWGGGVPTNINGQALSGIPADNFSVRFSTNTTITTGIYDFTVVADGGVKLTINNQLVINDLASRGLLSRTATVTITGGQSAIVLDYVDYEGNASVQISWRVSNGTPNPQTSLTPVATTRPIVAANVVGVRGLSVRSGPFLGATLLEVARPDTNYPILGRNTQEGLYTWFLIQFDVDTRGWISGRYVAIINGNSESIPLIATTEFDTVVNQRGRVIGMTDSVLNFRQYPSPRSPVIAALPRLLWGSEVEILARTTRAGADYWYKVRYQPANSTVYYDGWVLADFVEIIGGSAPIDAVPRL